MTAANKNANDFPTLPVNNGYAPGQGPKAVSCVIDLATYTSVVLDLLTLLDSDALSFVQSIYFDNSLNSDSLTILNTGTNQTITVPPNSQGYLPILSPKPSQIAFTSGGGVEVGIQLLNVPIPAVIWETTGAAGGGLTGADFDSVFKAPNGWANHSSTITLGGTSQQALAANANRVRFLIQNPSTESESLYIDFGATAAAAGTSIELLPGGSYQEQAPCSKQAVNVNAATTSHVYICKEES